MNDTLQKLLREEKFDELYTMLCALPHCEKGLCLTPATGIASYTHEGRVVASWPSCDRHGGSPRVDFEFAETIRVACAALRDRDFDLWWDAYSGPLNPPTAP